MREEHVLRADLDLMFPADGLDVEENIIFDAYWAFDCAGLSIIAHVFRHFDEERSRCHDDPRIEVRKRSKRTMQCPASFLYFEPLFWGR